MNVRRILGLGLAVAALSVLVANGIAHAEGRTDNSDDAGYPSTQSPTQGLDATGATAGDMGAQFLDAAKGRDRPPGADGTESDFGGPDPRYLEGPLGGLVKDGPLR
jgi:hypothetical protein